MFCNVFAGVLVTALATYHTYHVHPNDKLCVQLPCPTLQNMVDRSYMYFRSNTTLLFAEGKYYHISSDIIIQNIINFLLIGTPNITDPTSPLSVIKCLPENSIYFYNVVNILIKNLKFESCGYFVSKFTDQLSFTNHWTSLFLNNCTTVEIVNVCIDNPVGYGITGYNVMGDNSIENTTVIMNRQDLHGRLLFTCSYGMQWSYNGYTDKDRVVLVNITNIRLIDIRKSGITCVGQSKVLEISIRWFSVFINIQLSNFSIKSSYSILKFTITSSTCSGISFYKCNFVRNIAPHVLHFASSLPCVLGLEQTVINVTFTEITFEYNSYMATSIANGSILLLKVSSLCTKFRVQIAFKNVLFYLNNIALLQVLSNTPLLAEQHSEVLISTTGYFIVEENTNHMFHSSLISVTNGYLQLNGNTIFSRNYATEVLYTSLSTLSFSNNIMFDNNYCNQIINLNCKLCYLKFLNQVNLTFHKNSLYNELIKVTVRSNHPHPYCLLQYYSPTMNYKDFHMLLLLNREKLDSRVSSKGNEIINKLTSHCKWAKGATFQKINPLTINKKIINLHFENGTSPYQLGIHTTVCYCPPSSHYNCSVDQLGPVYPGENLTVDLCLPYNDEETGVMYAETYNDNLPKSACLINEHSSMKHIFRYGKRKRVHFAIASEQPVCELFLTAQPHLYTLYDAFYVHLLPCPLGFTLQHGICDCDPDLRKYIDECEIHTQTIRQFSNVYILGTVSDNSTKLYIVTTNCPTYYCLQDTARINLKDPDAQCQHHRTSLLCSQCRNGYSVVFGSDRCKKCSNTHLLFILFTLSTGLLLVVLLFCLNLTVTSGTMNGLILYVNIIEINGSFFHLQNKLVTILQIYISITNLGSNFEMCFYNGMNMYVKKWVQFTYPIYLILIAISFVIGSRYSAKLYRLTYNRALPVLATLFMLTYTSILQAISSTPLYTTIITIPSHSSKNLWLLDPTIPLFGWKFSLLISVCLLLFLFLLMFNVILLFTKPLMRFKMIHQYKPLIDAFQGPFKSQYYYWIGIQLLIRNMMVLLSILGKTISVTTGCLLIITMAIIHSLIQPNKEKLINYQELFLLYNYVVVCILLMFISREDFNVIAINIMVGLSFIQLLVTMVFHMFTYMYPCNKLVKKVTSMWKHCGQNCHRGHMVNNESGIELMEAHFPAFQEPLIGED